MSLPQAQYHLPYTEFRNNFRKKVQYINFGYSAMHIFITLDIFITLVYLCWGNAHSYIFKRSWEVDSPTSVRTDEFTLPLEWEVMPNPCYGKRTQKEEKEKRENEEGRGVLKSHSLQLCVTRSLWCSFCSDKTKSCKKKCLRNRLTLIWQSKEWDTV
jgi:hypothetical protein